MGVDQVPTNIQSADQYGKITKRNQESYLNEAKKDPNIIPFVKARVLSQLNPDTLPAAPDQTGFDKKEKLSNTDDMEQFPKTSSENVSKKHLEEQSAWSKAIDAHIANMEKTGLPYALVVGHPSFNPAEKAGNPADTRALILKKSVILGKSEGLGLSQVGFIIITRDGSRKISSNDGKTAIVNRLNNKHPYTETDLSDEGYVEPKDNYLLLRGDDQGCHNFKFDLGTPSVDIVKNAIEESKVFAKNEVENSEQAKELKRIEQSMKDAQEITGLAASPQGQSTPQA